MGVGQLRGAGASWSGTGIVCLGTGIPCCVDAFWEDLAHFVQLRPTSRDQSWCFEVLRRLRKYTSVCLKLRRRYVSRLLRIDGKQVYAISTIPSINKTAM
jgi:hypothetical protein